MDITLERIIDLIKIKGITDKQFLKDNGLARSAMSDWKSGRITSYKKNIADIAYYFGVSTDYLLGKTDDPAPKAQTEATNELRKLLDRKKNIGTLVAFHDGEPQVIELSDDEADLLKSILKTYRDKNK